MNRRVLLIIPAYNEVVALPIVLREITALKFKADVLVVDDGSSDGTSAIAQKSNVALLIHSVNKGVGASIRNGLQYALNNDYDLAIQVDGDGQHNPSFLPHFLEAINQGADMVIGSRFLIKNSFSQELNRRFGRIICSRLLSYFCGVVITDPMSGYRAFNRSTMRLMTRHFADKYAEAETLVFLLNQSIKVVEIPVICRDRWGGMSSITFFRSLKLAYEIPFGMWRQWKLTKLV